MVVDVAKLSAGREEYYTREIAEDREEYLSGHGESPGRWYGAGAASLGQSGEASTHAFRRIFEGRHPETGELLGRLHGRNAVPAFDVVLRPTKSVSALYGLGDAATGRAVLAAHHAGLTEAVVYLDGQLGARRRHGGAEHVGGNRLLAVGFRPARRRSGPAAGRESPHRPACPARRWARRPAAAAAGRPARAIATRCCSPPDSCSGNLPASAATPTSSRAASASARAVRARTPSSSRGRATFSAAVSPPSRFSSLEHVADPAAAQRGQRAAAQAAQVSAGHPDAPAAGAVQAAGQVQQGRLAGAAWAHHRHQLGLGRGRPPGCDDRQAAGATTGSGTRQRQACQAITAVQEISRRLKKA